MNKDKKNKGLYLGTVIDNKWWKRYTKGGLFSRGNGEYWFDDKGFYFRRFLMKAPIFIPFNSVFEVELGKWHAGRWAYGNFIIKLLWKKENFTLSSGFIISRNKEEILKLKKILEEKIKK